MQYPIPALHFKSSTFTFEMIGEQAWVMVMPNFISLGAGTFAYSNCFRCHEHTLDMSHLHRSGREVGFLPWSLLAHNGRPFSKSTTLSWSPISEYYLVLGGYSLLDVCFEWLRTRRRKALLAKYQNGGFKPGQCEYATSKLSCQSCDILTNEILFNVIMRMCSRNFIYFNSGFDNGTV